MTVVLPVYHEPIDVIRRAADSVCFQTYTDLSVLLVLDDPDNESALNFLRSYCAQRDRAGYKVNQRNLGLAASLNSAIEGIDGGLVCRMDADDVSHPNRVERQVTYLKEHHLDLVGCYMNVVDENGRTLYQATGLPKSADSVRSALRYNNCVMHPTWLGRVAVFRQSYRQMPLSEDYDLLLRSVEAGFNLGNCPQVLLDYTLSPGSISRSNLLRQYLFQKVLSNSYAARHHLEVDDAIKYVDAHWTSARELRYDDAYSLSNTFLGLTSAKERAAMLPRLLGALARSPQYVDKAYRLAMTRIIGVRDVGYK